MVDARPTAASPDAGRHGLPPECTKAPVAAGGGGAGSGRLPNGIDTGLRQQGVSSPTTRPQPPRSRLPHGHTAPQRERIPRRAAGRKDTTAAPLFPAAGAPRQGRKRFPRHYSVGVTARPASPQALGAVRSPTLWHGGASVAPPGRGTAVRRRPCPGPQTPCHVCACGRGVGPVYARGPSPLLGAPPGFASDANRPPRHSWNDGDWPPPDATPRRPDAWSAGSGDCAPSRRRPVGVEPPPTTPCTASPWAMCSCRARSRCSPSTPSSHQALQGGSRPRRSDEAAVPAERRRAGGGGVAAGPAWGGTAPPGCGPRRSAAASRCGHHRRHAAAAGPRSAPALAAQRTGALPASDHTALGRWPPRRAGPDDPVTGPTAAGHVPP